MAGYYGFSMSNNAAHAYDSGEMPLSKWTKATILEQCGEKAPMLKSLTAKELKCELLYNSSWHHTSKYFNRTEFYSIDDEALEEIDEKRVLEIIAKRKPRQPKKVIVPQTITAEIKYTVWVGSSRNYRRPKEYIETVTYESGCKMLKTQHGNKRMSSITVLKILKKDV